MGRINAVLDEEVDYGFEGGGEYRTDGADLENGYDERDSAWKFPKHKYSASFGNIQEETRDALINVFHACRGARHSFMFKDWNDYEAILEPLVVPEGTSGKIQLYKTYSFGQAYTIRPVQALKPGTCVLYDVTAPETPVPVAGTFNALTGEFTPDADWLVGHLFAWTGEFFVWVRFGDDYNGMTINGWRDHTADVELIEDPLKITATNVPASWEE